MIIVCLDPKTPPMSFNDFKRVVPINSIALDGYVNQGPRYDLQGPWFNFNHHEEVSRLETRSTCEQVLMAIRMGLMETFRRNDHISVWVNDCDEDVCTSIWLLKNAHLARSTMNPRLNRLVYVEGLLDATAGAYPFPADMPMLEELAWVFQPYRLFRTSGQLYNRVSEDFLQVIESVCHRIDKYVFGGSSSCSLDPRYETLNVVGPCHIVRELGSHARMGMFGNGIKAFLAYSERKNGNATMTLGRVSPFVDFPVLDFAAEFNRLENCREDCWGGGDTIIGSPRVTGTKLTLEKVVDVISDYYSRVRDIKVHS